MLTHVDESSAGQITGTEWDKEHQFGGGAIGAILQRDTGATYGASWITPAAGFLANAGSGVSAFRALLAADIPQLAYSSLSGRPTLGGAAALEVGTGAGTVAAGNHTHAYSALSGLPTLGGAASLNVGTTAGTVAAGDHTHAGVYEPAFTTLPATKGGTDNIIYAVGDLLQASTTTALARLAAVATGNVLLSGGVGVVSAWGKVTLTGHVSGILPTANGGTASAFFAVSGPTIARTYAFPDANATVLTTAAAVTVAQGGTGLTGLTTGDMYYASGTDTLAKLAAGASGTVLTGGTAPAWSASPTLTNLAIVTDLYSSVAATATIGATNRFKSARLGGNTVTTSAPVMDIAQTWNASGVSFKGSSHVYTETASASGSRYFEILGGASGATDEFYITKGGVGYFKGALTAASLDVGSGMISGDRLSLSSGLSGSSSAISINSGSLRIGANYASGYAFFDYQSNYSPIKFLVNPISPACMILEYTGSLTLGAVVGTGTGAFYCGTLRPAAITFANRPGTPVEGDICTFSDSSTTTWGATITGGGANHVAGRYNGTNWTCFGA